MEILTSLLYTAVFLWIIQKASFFKAKGLSFPIVGGIFLLKIIAGVGLTFLYTFHYPDRTEADIFKYFDDSQILFDALRDRPEDYFRMLFSVGIDNDYFHHTYFDVMNSWIREFESATYNDGHTIIRLNAVIRIFSFGYFTVHTIFMCFISLLGLVGIYKSLIPFFKDRLGGLMVGVFLLPSVIFWTSGVLKEGVLLFAMGFLLYAYFGMIHEGYSLKKVAIFVLAIGLLLISKFYILMAVAPGMLAYFLTSQQKKGTPLLIYLLVLGGSSFLAIYLSPLLLHFDPLDILARKQGDFINLAILEQSGSRFALTPLEPTLSSFLLLIPEALFNVIFRPFPGESFAPLVLAASIENYLTLALFILFLVYRKPLPKTSINIQLFFLFFVLILFILIGWITPVTGAIVRYKVPVLPFLFLFFLSWVDPSKILQKFPFLNSIYRILFPKTS